LQALRPDPLPILTSPNPPAHVDTVELQDLLHNEKAKRQRWDFENAIRRHNHLGLAVGLLQALANVSLNASGSGANGAEGETQSNLWDKTMQDARDKMKTRIEKRREMMAAVKKGGKIPEGMELDE
jgi:ubiquitin carboxyl-terminal hydrolase L5